MPFFRNLLDGARAILRKKHVEREMDEELRAYLDDAAREHMRRGMNPEEARRAARMGMGSVESVKESVRAAGWETRLETLWRDLHFGARMLRLNPLFAAAAILSLALGIGANTAIFQLINALRLRRIPVSNPQEIARIAIENRHNASGNFSSRYPDLTYALWEQIRAKQQGFSSVLAWSPSTFNISPGGEVRNVQGLWVSGEFFETLGVQPSLGRLLTPDDDRRGCGASPAVISYSFWRRAFGQSPSVLGQTVTVGRRPFSIVGVAPAGFYGIEVGRDFDIAAPLCSEEMVDGENNQIKNRSGWWLSVLGRLKPGWTVEQATAQLHAISGGAFEAALPPEYNSSTARSFLGFKLKAFPAECGLSDLREGYQAPLWLLLALAGIVLLISAANLANLLLARATTRQKEMGVRMAVGAGRGRLIRQLLAESLLLALIGAGLGGLLAQGLSSALVASLTTTDNPLFVDLRMDWRVLGFTTALALLTSVLFGLAPAFRATNVTPGVALRESNRGSTGGRSRFALRRILVVTQIALSLTLLVGALLFARSLNNLARLDAWFRQDGILIADIDFTPLHLAAENRRAFSTELLKRVREIPGIDAAAAAAVVPLSGDSIGHDILPDTGDGGDSAPTVVFNIVSPGYFDTLQTPLLAGRDFNDRDTPGSPNVAIVNRSFAKQFGNGGNMVGKTFRVRVMNKITTYEVIGLVQNTKYIELREDSRPIVYTAKSQHDRPGTDALLLIRSRTNLASLMTAVKEAAGAANPDMDISFSTLRKTIDDGLVGDRLMAALSGFFGCLAVVLAVIGLYGVISYTGAQRRNEIAIRMAMGAGRGNILRLVLQEAAVLLAAGLVIGTGLALAGGNAAAAMLFGLKPWDIWTFLMAHSGLGVVAVAASLLPAIRASLLDPMTALRDE
ncbi:MAG TPA: ABC transporter permease [Methylomirabilota bacterium]|nr:ABC transporter permease [Methylomirabilota bacterium]